MIRSCGQLRKVLARRTFAGPDPQAAAAAIISDGVLQSFSPWNTTVRLCHSGKPKDYSLPNPSWSKEMMEQFNKFTEMTKDGTWQRLRSYRNTIQNFPEKVKERYNIKKNENTRLFLRNLDGEGLGFEYVMFLNSSEKRMECLFQFGPYLKGPPGCAHGGSIATVLDTVLGSLALCLGYKVMTANLSINYKSPIPLGSVVMVRSRLDRIEGRKMFITGEARSVDGQTLHADATGLFIQLQA